jgi:hypothetical protein
LLLFLSDFGIVVIWVTPIPARGSFQGQVFQYVLKGAPTPLTPNPSPRLSGKGELIICMRRIGGHPQTPGRVFPLHLLQVTYVKRR